MLFASQFYERMRHYEEQEQRRRHELTEKTRHEQSELIEKCLAGEYKLKSSQDDIDYNALEGLLFDALVPPLVVYEPV